MKTVQTVIVVLVIWSNIYWKWTPNGLLAGALGIGAAWMITVLPLHIIDWVQSLYSRWSRQPPEAKHE